MSGLRSWISTLLGLVIAVILSWAGAAPDFDLMQRLADERYGPKAVQMVSDWRRMIADAANLNEQDKLRRANTFFNRHILFKDDTVTWNKNDYWATPLETMGKGAGDCEDYSIAKYITLRLMGIPPEKLRLIYVRAQIGGPRSELTQAHMVLGYYAIPTDEPLVLDNLISEIRPAARRKDLSPIFSFNMDGLWVGGKATSAADPTTRLSRWRDTLDRITQEGLL